jgi:hypothetical protein
MLVGVFAGLSALVVGMAPAPSTCQVNRIKMRWEGSCGLLFGHPSTLTISPAKSVVTGAWRKDTAPAEVWAGEAKFSWLPAQPIEIEVYAGGMGVLRTALGWFPTSGFTHSADRIRFQMDVTATVPPSELDRELVQRADMILSSERVWNRADNLQCPAEATTWSIYCAMERAAIEITGSFHHRRPALELTRIIIEERAGGKYGSAHRLMSYNNDRSTRLEDVRSLFAEAVARMSR